MVLLFQALSLRAASLGPSPHCHLSPATCPPQVKLHPWFVGLDWASLARQKAAFVPTLDNEFDTSYFACKPVRAPPQADAVAGGDSRRVGCPRPSLTLIWHHILPVLQHQWYVLHTRI